MSTAVFDPVAALRVLDRFEVRHLVIGGYAATLLGAPLVTNDLDICYERTPANMTRLAAALQAMDTRLRVARVQEDLPFLLDARTLAAGDSFTFLTRYGSLDILGTPSGTSGFRDLEAQARRMRVAEDLEVDVVGLQDLMRMKRASGRVKDKLQLEVLAALSEMVDEAEAGEPS